MKLSLFGRLTMALLASMALGLGMTACGGGTIGYMWVLGQQYNQIAGFKIDDYTGNLTTVPESPFSTGGSVPVSIVVKAGGRFIYVVSQGVNGGIQNVGGVPTLVKGVGQVITEFAVGGDGTLTYQATYQTQGFVSQWAQMDSSGSFLYVLDKYSPDATVAGCSATPVSTTTCKGSITVFSSDINTGRLSLVTNSQTQLGGLNTYYWDVSATPIMMKAVGSCLLTLNSTGQSISPYQIGNNGQLVYPTTGVQLLNTVSASSINGTGSYVYITDTNNGAPDNYVYPYTLGGGCTLTIVNGGKINQGPGVPVTNPGLALGVLNPTQTLLDNSGKYLYVLNQTNTNTTTPLPFSSISAYTVNAVTGQLQTIAGSPYTVGSGPQCIVEDPTNQYIYISNHNDGTVTGKVIDPTTGNLSGLSRGSTFTATGLASCLVLSGAVS